jgi:predicted aldo/keto reductase-like oxidoreductase
LERAAADNFIQYYGTATWNGYYSGDLSLGSLLEIAREVAGSNHRFRFVQLPLNLGLQEALSQKQNSAPCMLKQAEDLGLTVIASASLMQGRLSQDLPDEIKEIMFGLATDAQRAIQFARSTPGICCALVGMRQLAHVVENLVLARVPPLTPDEYERLDSLI